MKRKPKAAAGGSHQTISRHRSVWEMRSDGWIGLVDDLGWLATMTRDEPEWESCRQRQFNGCKLQSYRLQVAGWAGFARGMATFNL